MQGRRPLPGDLYRPAQVRELDRLAIEEHGVPGGVLMDRAGRAAFRCLRAHWPEARRIAVVCGMGNNAGDGYVVARLARGAGLAVEVLEVGAAPRTGSDAHAARESMLAAGQSTVAAGDLREALSGCEVIVDAIFGTGLNREVEGAWKEAIEAVNAAPCPVLSLDVPSGLDAETGASLGESVQASVTVSFGALKQGMCTGRGRSACGDIWFDDIGLPPEARARVVPSAERLDLAGLAALLPPRAAHAHKGHFGHVLVVGGDRGYAGAARMAAEGAARVGAGLVSVVTRQGHAGFMLAARPEIMVHEAETVRAAEAAFERATVIAIGPGLGRSRWSRSMWAAVRGRAQGLIVDADGLNLLAESPCRREDWVLTPHPGEGARLLGGEARAIERDRFSSARRIVESYGGVCVLKGAGTLVAAGEGRLGVCSAGNPGMASGGMGDVLTGVIAGLAAQGLSLRDAARLGVCLHASAGDAAAADGERGLLASDLFPHLRRLANR